MTILTSLTVLAAVLSILTALDVLGTLLLRGSLLLLSLLLTNLLSLLRLSLLSLLGEGSSVGRAREQRGDENVLHDESEVKDRINRVSVVLKFGKKRDEGK